MLLEKIYELPFIKDTEKYGIYKKELKKNNWKKIIEKK